MADHKDLVGSALHIAKSQVSTGDPNSVVTAGVIGELYYDSTADVLYVAEAADNVSWIAVTASTAGDIVGPSSSVSGALVYFSDTTGKLADDIPGVTTDGVDVAFADDILLTFGDTNQFSISHSGTFTTFTTTGSLQFHSTFGTGTIDFDLGSDDQNTGVRFRNLTNNTFLRIDSDGTDTEFTNVLGGLVFTTSSAELTFSAAGKLSIPADLATPQFTIGANDDFQFFHTGTKSHMQNFVGDLDILVVTGDLVVETSTLGHFLFTQNELRAGVSTSEYLSIGHDGTNTIINAVGDGLMNFDHEGTTVMTLSDAHVLNFTAAATISNDAGDITLAPTSEVNISSDLNFDGGGQINIKQAGSTVITIDKSGNFNTGGDLFTFNVVEQDYSGDRLDVTQEVTAPEISISETFTFHEGSTQHVAAIPDLRSGRIDTLSFNRTESVFSEENNPQHLYIRVDGIKLYIVGEGGNGVDEYDMTTPWDTSTMSHVRFFSVASEDNGPKGIFFKPDGLRMYIAGNQNESVYQYDLGTAWNISTAVYNNDFVDVSTNTLNPASIVFKPDGSGFFVVAFNAGTNTLSHYGMSTLWDVSTASFLNSFSPSEPTDLSGVGFRNDGVLLYLTSTSDDTIYEYFLGTPWNTTGNTAFLGSRITNGDGSSSPRGVFFSPFYHKMYFCDSGDDSVFEFDLGVAVEGKVKSSPSNIVDIHDFADLEANAVSAVWTISEDTTLNWLGDVEASIRFSIDAGITLHINGNNRATAKYTYDGSNSTTLFSGEGALRIFGMKNIDSNDNATFVSLTGGGTLNIRDCLNITGWNMGSTNGQVFGIDSVFVSVDSGFDFVNPTLINITDWAVEGNDLGAHFIRINTNNPASIINFTDVSGLSLSASGALFHLQSTINKNATINIRNCKVASDDDGNPVGTIFEPPTSGTETVTVVADSSPANGTITAQSDNGSSGTTHSSTTTYFEEEEVTITGTTSYNGTFQIFNVVAGVSFDTITAFVADDATGTVASTRIDFTTSAAHLTFAGDAIKVSDSNFYNGFYTVLNVPDTLSVIVNGNFVITDTATYVDGGGIDQSDPRVVAVGNGKFVDSHYIATAYVNNNSTANGTIVNNTFTDMVFGTAGSALVAGSTMERWRLVDELNGTFEYFGNEPFDGEITFDFTVVSSGGTVEFRFKWAIDTGSGFGDLRDDVEALIDVAANVRSVSKTFPLTASKGDQIKPQITRNGGTSTITTTYATIMASQ